LRVISRVNRKEEGEIEVIFEGVSTTFVDPLVDSVLQEDSSASASYVVEHHLKGPLRMRVKSAKQPPEELIARAIDRLISDLDKVKSDLERTG